MIEFWYPAALGLVGSAQLLVVAGPSTASVTCATVLVAASIGIGRRLSRPRPKAVVSDGVAEAAAATRTVCVKSFEVWARQIETSRVEANEAILRLSQLFDGTVRRLEASLVAARRSIAEMRGSDGVIAAVARGDEDLHRVMQDLLSAQKRREAAVGVHARDLRDMAAEVQRIAMQIRMLSFNAAVEAARAGDAAGGFAVVASEMRQLAAVSGETGAGMVKKVEVINATLEELVRAEKSAAGSDVDAMVEAERAIRAVTERFGQLAGVLSEAVEVMEANAGRVHGDISEALVAMQFQDRVSQIQQHVVNGLAALGERLQRGNAAGLDVARWESRLARDFSTQEEFDNLLGVRPTARAQPASDITFF